jgi:phosphate acetyltransferase
MGILEAFAEKAKKLDGAVIFAEGDEERTLRAASSLVKDKICDAIMVATDVKTVDAAAEKAGVDLKVLKVISPDLSLLDNKVLEDFVAVRQGKGLEPDEAKKLALEPLTFSALYVKSGKANACIAGARSSTADVLRAAIHGIGVAEGAKIISSFFIMLPPAGHTLIKDPIIFADCAVNPEPNSSGLKDIACSSISSFKSLFPRQKADVAFLSFSTKGSATHRMADKVIEAVSLTKEIYKNDALVSVDGEMQFDAAAVPSVGAKKAPGSVVAGKANIFIFPDLNAGNISYKITERLGLFTAIGPIVQGLAMPMNDLSRGCSDRDIYYVACISLLKSKC